MKGTGKTIFTILIEQFLARYKCAFLDLAKLRAAAWYLRAVQILRFLVLAAIGLGVCLLLLVTGFVFLHVALLLVVDWTAAQKALFLLIAGLVYLLVPLGIILYAVSHKLWMEKTGAEDVVDQVIRDTRHR